MKTGKHALLAILLATSACGAHATQDDEQAVGNAAAAALLGATPVLAKAPLQQYLNLVGASLASLSERPQLSWRFAVTDDPAVNAFAAPGGVVLVTWGLLQLLDSEDELAAVLAHEIGHVVRKHHYSVVQRQRLADEATRTMAAGGKDAEMDALSKASSLVFARGLDKRAEFDADAYALQLTTRAGYDPSAVLGMLDKLRTLNAGDSRAALLFATHPSAAERLDRLLQHDLDSLPRARANAAREARFAQARALVR
jgi:predicted Zn-dependent protease